MGMVEGEWEDRIEWKVVKRRKAATAIGIRYVLVVLLNEWIKKRTFFYKLIYAV